MQRDVPRTSPPVSPTKSSGKKGAVQMSNGKGKFASNSQIYIIDDSKSLLPYNALILDSSSNDADASGNPITSLVLVPPVATSTIAVSAREGTIAYFDPDGSGNDFYGWDPSNQWVSFTRLRGPADPSGGGIQYNNGGVFDASTSLIFDTSVNPPQLLVTGVMNVTDTSGGNTSILQVKNNDGGIEMSSTVKCGITGTSSAPISLLTNNGDISCNITGTGNMFFDCNSGTISLDTGTIIDLSANEIIIKGAMNVTDTSGGNTSILQVKNNDGGIEMSSTVKCGITGTSSAPISLLTNNGDISCNITGTGNMFFDCNSGTISLDTGTIIDLSANEIVIKGAMNVTDTSGGNTSIFQVKNNDGGIEMSSTVKCGITGTSSAPISLLTNNGDISCNITGTGNMFFDCNSGTISLDTGTIIDLSANEIVIKGAMNVTDTSGGNTSILQVKNNDGGIEMSSTVKCGITGISSAPISLLTNNGDISCNITGTGNMFFDCNSGDISLDASGIDLSANEIVIHGALIMKYETAQAPLDVSGSLTIPDKTGVYIITPATDPSGNFTLIAPSGTAGQVLYVRNNDPANSATGLVVPANSGVTFVSDGTQWYDVILN